MTGTTLEKHAQAAWKRLHNARTEIGRVILGQSQIVDHALITVLSGGHALLVGVPGLAKTKLVETLGITLGLNAKRVQFTPDLMPADIIGSEVLEETTQGKRRFRFIQGPVFCQLLMADEINRASPRTQSALLQAMQEKFVTIAGAHHTLPTPFHVLATQNPIEQEGTYLLPEAQLDRFLFQIDVNFPDESTEKQILLSTTGTEDPCAKAIFTTQQLIATQKLVRQLPIGDKIVDAIVKLIRQARPEQSELEAVRMHVAWGPGPRAGQALMLACRAKALLEKRLAPSLDDVLALVEPTLKHRMSLSFAARAEGQTLQDLITQIKHTLC